MRKKETKKFSSQQYWEKRYQRGGNSGAGSYSHLAQFKASVINNFIEENRVKSIIEFGSGDGNNLSLYNIEEYIGIDVSEEIIKQTKLKFINDNSKKFFHVSEFFSYEVKDMQRELTLSLDVIYHLIEDSVFNDYMKNLFKYSSKYVIIYSSNKNELHMEHVKHRKFTDWVTQNQPHWELAHFIENQYPYDTNNPDSTTFSDFYIYQKVKYTDER